MPCAAHARSRDANGEPGTIGASPQWLGTTNIAKRLPTCESSRSTSWSTSLSKRGETSWMDASIRRVGWGDMGLMCDSDGRPASPLTKLHLKFTPADRHLRLMRIADVCAFYTPAGGGVRTYVEAKLKAAPRFGHEMIVIAPGE